MQYSACGGARGSSCSTEAGTPQPVMYLQHVRSSSRAVRTSRAAEGLRTTSRK